MFDSVGSNKDSMEWYIINKMVRPKVVNSLNKMRSIIGDTWKKEAILGKNQMTNKNSIRVFTGIPEYSAKSIFLVDRECRTNSLSHSLGGTDIIVEFKNGNVGGWQSCSIWDF